VVFDSPPNALKWQWRISSNLFSVQGNAKMALTLSVVQQVTLSIHPVDARGNSAPIDGVPVWSVSDPTIATLTPTDDGLSATLVALTIGHEQVTVSADARLGSDVSTISGVLEVDVVAAEAVTLGITAGEPENQP
jgi:hypothetical protein